MAKLLGWGRVGSDEHVSGNLDGMPWKLRQATLPLVPDASCSSIYQEGANFEIQETMQCAGGDGRTSCNGDSGGPLVCFNDVDQKWYQVLAQT